MLRRNPISCAGNACTHDQPVLRAAQPPLISLIGVVINWLGLGAVGNDAFLPRATESYHFNGSLAEPTVPILEVDVAMRSERVFIVYSAPKNECQIAHSKGKNRSLLDVRTAPHSSLRVGSHIPLHVFVTRLFEAYYRAVCRAELMANSVSEFVSRSSAEVLNYDSYLDLALNDINRGSVIPG